MSQSPDKEHFGFDSCGQDAVVPACDLDGRDPLLRALDEKRCEAELLAGELRKERDNRALVMENTPKVGLALLDRSFNFVMVNTTYLKASGFEHKEELIGRNYFDLFSAQENRTIFAEAMTSVRGMAFEEKPFELQAQAGIGTNYCDWTLTPVKDSEGGVDGIVLSLVDVSEKVQATRLGDALNQINLTINSTTAFDVILMQVIVQAAQALEAESALFGMVEQDEWLVRGAYGRVGATPVGSRFPLRQSTISSLANDKGPVAIADVAGYDGSLQGFLQGDDLCSILVLPLFRKQELMGVIGFRYHSQPFLFTPAHEDFARKLAASVSLALDNARLYESELEARAMIQSHATQLSLLHDIGLSLNKEIDPLKLLESVLSAGAELTSAGIGAMLLIRDGQSELVSSYRAPWSPIGCRIDVGVPKIHQKIAQLVPPERDVVRITDFEKIALQLSFPSGHPEISCLLVGTLRDSRGEPQGYFMLGNKAGEGSFTAQDEEIIALLAAQSSVALISAENFSREHHLAESLQSALLPSLPSRSDIELGLLYHAASTYGRVGGDFYDFIELEDGRIAIVIGDVCGKGLEAATYTAMIKYTLRAYLMQGLEVAEVLALLNRAVHQQLSAEKFVTMTLILIDGQSITYACAGHPLPVMCCGDDVGSLALPVSVPLGVMAETEFQAVSVDLPHDSCSLLLFTDGLLEARPPGGAPFGEARVAATLQQLQQLPATVQVDSLLEAVVAYSGGNLRDDVALVVAQLNPARRHQNGTAEEVRRQRH